MRLKHTKQTFVYQDKTTSFKISSQFQFNHTTLLQPDQRFSPNKIPLLLGFACHPSDRSRSRFLPQSSICLDLGGSFRVSPGKKGID